MTIAERIRSLVAAAPATSQLEDIGLSDPIWEHVAPLVYARNIMGTATFIAPGRALTAAHVTDEIFNRTQGVQPLAPGEMRYNETTKIAYAVRCEGNNTETQHILATVPAMTTDVAFLNLRANVGSTGPSERLTLTVSPPAIGSTVVAFGLAGSYEGHNSLRMNCNRVICRVVEILHSGRDQRLPFACIRTDIDFPAGMSGGPVFDAEGRVCAIVCSGALEPYAALLWPAFGSIIGHDSGGAVLESPMSVLDWLSEAQVPIHDRQKLTIADDGTPLYHHGLGTKESPLPVEQSLTDLDEVASLTVHEIFDGGVKMSFVPKNPDANENEQVAQWCVQYILPSMDARWELDAESSTITATWKPGTTLKGPIRDLLAAADRATAERVRKMVSRFRERWEMDILLGR